MPQFHRLTASIANKILSDLSTSANQVQDGHKATSRLITSLEHLHHFSDSDEFQKIKDVSLGDYYPYRTPPPPGVNPHPWNVTTLLERKSENWH